MKKKILLGLMSVVLAFSIISPVAASENNRNSELSKSFSTMNVQEKIQLFKLNEIQDTLTSNETIKVEYSSINQFGVEQTSLLNVTTDNNRNIIQVEIVSSNIGTKHQVVPNRGKKTSKKSLKAPYKLNGGTTRSGFINDHAYDRHKYDPNVKSTSSKTQYGKDVDVKQLRESTIHEPDLKWHTLDKSGVSITTYAKSFSSNISTNDTPTEDHRVFINHTNPERSTHFPLSFKQ